MMGGYYGWNAGGMLFGGLMMIIVWGGLLALVFLAIRAFTKNGNLFGQFTGGSDRASTPAQTSIEILKARYAKGEVTKEQYETMRQDLQGT